MGHSERIRILLVKRGNLSEAELARRIVEYRTARGAFQSIEELAEVSGIGRETVELLSDQITVGDEAEE